VHVEINKKILLIHPMQEFKKIESGILIFYAEKAKNNSKNLK